MFPQAVRVVGSVGSEGLAALQAHHPPGPLNAEPPSQGTVAKQVAFGCHVSHASSMEGWVLEGT
jgi:hypothetical protein